MYFSLQYSATILLFFSSFLLIPMDPPKQHIEDKSQQDLCKSLSRLQTTGGIFSNFPQETLIPVLITLAPECKNNLRKTNGSFNILLSRENPQPFMFCKELCATPSDKVCLGIKMLNSVDARNGRWNLDNLRMTTFMHNTFLIKDKEEKLIRFDLSDLSNPSLNIVTTSDNSVNIKNMSPFIRICLTRCSNDIKEYFEQLHDKQESTKKLTNSDHEFLDFFLIQNDDANSLELMHSSQIYKKEINASKLLQLAIFCGSARVIPTLVKLYRKNRTENAIDSFHVGYENDYIGIFLGIKKDLQQIQSIESALKKYHPHLIEKNTNNKDNYYACLRQAFNDKFIRTLVPEIPAVSEQRNVSKTKKKNENCIIN